MKTLYQEVKEAVIVNRYTEAGLMWGDFISYDFCGDTPSKTWSEIKFNYWERKYIALGYVPLSLHDWILAGGYGAKYEHLLRTKTYAV